MAKSDLQPNIVSIVFKNNNILIPPTPEIREPTRRIAIKPTHQLTHAYTSLEKRRRVSKFVQPGRLPSLAI